MLTGHLASYLIDSRFCLSTLFTVYPNRSSQTKWGFICLEAWGCNLSSSTWLAIAQPLLFFAVGRLFVSLVLRCHETLDKLPDDTRRSCEANTHPTGRYVLFWAADLKPSNFSTGNQWAVIRSYHVELESLFGSQWFFATYTGTIGTDVFHFCYYAAIAVLYQSRPINNRSRVSASFSSHGPPPRSWRGYSENSFARLLKQWECLLSKSQKLVK